MFHLERVRILKRSESLSSTTETSILSDLLLVFRTVLAPAWLLLVLQYVGMVQVADTQLSMPCPGALPVSVQFFTGVCFFCSVVF